MSTPKRKRVILDLIRKTEFLEFYKEHPKNKQQQIADVFTTKWDLPINCRTVRDILTERDAVIWSHLQDKVWERNVIG